MSQDNVEIIRSAYEQFTSTGQIKPEILAADIRFDMSRFPGWVERSLYLGLEGVRELVEDWTSVWDAWEVELDAILDAGEQVIVLVRQRSRSHYTQLPVSVALAQVWTLRDGKAISMEGYATPGDALRACGLAA